ncbi:hypothetical protein OJ997_30585 [Solirubrobacter phytolaccae]|uniref:Uncharacterized protein n=1 Tax=Solirubrobacter phytolaccae TaxID=1404360 RepID=A0A9X3NG44_9ACTN|nr:hypothetical protein [Solirubrobacter phytolaccae]MDA0184689.1 hypothetical protein [Solirubrobacter phytolaccae]
MTQSLLSPSRRWAALVALLASGAVLGVLLVRGEDPSAAVAARGNVGLCTNLKGDAARDCYAREVGRELVAAGGRAGTPQAIFAAPDESTTNVVTFASQDDTSAALLCELHIRVGATDESTPSWTSWVAQ